MSPKERLEKKLATVPKRYRKTVERAIRGSAPPRSAIKAQCLECVGFVLSEVRLCNSFICPLYMYRPYKE